MRRKFIFNLILLVFLNLLVKPFYILGIDTEILERVGQGEYGMYFALMNLSFLLNIFLDMGIVNFNTNYIARHEHLVTKHFPRIIALRLLLILFYLIICFGAAMIFGYSGRSLYLLFPICVTQILAGLIMYLRSNLAGLQLFVRDSIISVLDRIILIVACAAVLWGNFTGLEMSIELFILFQMHAYAITLLVAFLMLTPKIRNMWPRFRFSFSLVVLKQSFPYALLILLMTFYYRTDGIMLERMLANGAYEAGIYAQGFRFYEAGNMIAYLFAALLFPMFSRLIGHRQDVTHLLSLAFRIMVVGSVIGGLAGFYYSSQIMDLRFSTEVEAAAASFQFLMIGFIGVSGTYVFGTLLTANGNLRSLNILAIAGALLNIALNLVLIPRFKASGAAFASMVTQLTMAALQVYMVKRKMDTGLDRALALRTSVFTLVMILLGYLLTHLVQLWYLGMGILAASGILLSLAFGILSLNSVFEYIRLSRVMEPTEAHTKDDNPPV